MTSLSLVYTKETLIAALEKLRPAAKRADAKAKAKHVVDEADMLKRFRTACREALKWSYTTASNATFNVRVKAGPHGHWGPQCPKLQDDTLRHLIAEIKLSAQKRYTLSNGGKYNQIYKLLTAHIPPVEKAC